MHGKESCRIYSLARISDDQSIPFVKYEKIKKPYFNVALILCLLPLSKMQQLNDNVFIHWSLLPNSHHEQPPYMVASCNHWSSDLRRWGKVRMGNLGNQIHHGIKHIQSVNCSALNMTKCQSFRKFWHFFDGIYYVIWQSKYIVRDSSNES